jgi:hypothetical protein
MKQDVDTERLIGEVLDLLDLPLHFVGPESSATEYAKPSGVGNGSDEFRARDPFVGAADRRPHASQQHRVLNSKQVANPGTEHRSVVGSHAAQCASPTSGNASRRSIRAETVVAGTSVHLISTCPARLSTHPRVEFR